MNTDFRNSYERDINKIDDKTLKSEIKQAVVSIENAHTIADIPKLKKIGII